MNNQESHTEIYNIFLDNILKLNYFLILADYSYNENKADFKKLYDKFKKYGDIESEKEDMIMLNKARMFTELLLRLDEYIPFIFNLILVFSKSLFDYYIMDLIWNFHLEYPKFLQKSNKTLTYNEIFSYQLLNEIEEEIIHKELEKISFMSYDEIINYLRTVLSLSLIKLDDIREDIIEVCELRNIIIHNQGIINKRFLKKVNKDYYYINEKIELTNDDIKQFMDIFVLAASVIDEEVKKKLFKDKKTYSLHS